MAELVQYAHRGSAAVITINRPNQRNALSRALIAALSDAYHRANGDSTVRSVILKCPGRLLGAWPWEQRGVGTAPGSFCGR